LTFPFSILIELEENKVYKKEIGFEKYFFSTSISLSLSLSLSLSPHIYPTNHPSIYLVFNITCERESRVTSHYCVKHSSLVSHDPVDVQKKSPLIKKQHFIQGFKEVQGTSTLVRRLLCCFFLFSFSHLMLLLYIFFLTSIKTKGFLLCKGGKDVMR